jgi:hypothetical protein
MVRSPPFREHAVIVQLDELRQGSAEDTRVFYAAARLG